MEFVHSRTTRHLARQVSRWFLFTRETQQTSHRATKQAPSQRHPLKMRPLTLHSHLHFKVKPINNWKVDITQRHPFALSLALDSLRSACKQKVVTKLLDQVLPAVKAMVQPSKDHLAQRRRPGRSLDTSLPPSMRKSSKTVSIPTSI